MKGITVCSLVAAAATLTICQEDPLVITRSGPVKGKKVTENGKDRYEFLGIPFAEPPVGKLRFKPPVPVSPWSDVREAFSDGPACIQKVGEFLGNTEGTSEDCLTLNIFSPSLRSNKAVMLWIHGGGFTQGSKDIYRLTGLLSEDVVYVSINYRLHALGFLSFGNDLVSGNMGLRDQHLAIQWVRANIHLFGGDPDKITIFGESAGAVSVQAQVLSPHNSGVLRGAIAQSGSMLFANIEAPGAEKKYARNALEAINCPTTLDQRSLDCLQNIDIKKVNANLTESDEIQLDPEAVAKFNWIPVVDSYSSNPFLPTDPLEALMTGMFNRVPYMSGTVTYEGALLTGLFGLVGQKGRDIQKLILQPPKTAWNLNYGQDDIFNKVALRVYNHTTGDTRLEQEKPGIDFMTDATFFSSDQKTVELMSRHMRHVYNYYFTQQTNSSLLAASFQLPVQFTPMHADDLSFLISDKQVVDTDTFSEEERATSRHMIKYWANFAKYGNPSPSGSGDEQPVWFPVTPNGKVFRK